MNFLIPSALLGLGAMLVPLAIHFLSKKKKKEVLFGSLQFLQGSESPSARSIYLSQYLLLLLRMLLIAALCIAVAGPFISDSSEIGYAYIENDILQHETYSTLIEEIGQENTIVPFGFKSDSNCSDCQVFTSSWALRVHLNTLSDSIHVYTHNLLRDYNGSAVGLNKNIKWNVLPLQETESTRDTVYGTDSVFVLNILNDGEIFSPQIIKTSSIKTIDSSSYINVNVSASTRSQPVADQLIQMLADLAKFSPFKLVINGGEVEADWIFFIDSTTSVSQQAKVVEWTTSKDELELKIINKDYYMMRGDLNKKGIIATNLPVILAELMIDKKYYSEAHDFRVLEDNNLITNSTNPIISQSKIENPKNEMTYFVWICVLILLASERFMAHSNKEWL